MSYEAQAAIEMEMISRITFESYPYDLKPMGPPIHWGVEDALPEIKSSYEIVLQPLLTSIVKDVQENKPLSMIGSTFHRSLARIVGDVSHLISESTGMKEVALSGGCFQNRLLLRMSVEELRKHGLHPLLHHHVPTNDGGLSLGQAVIGHFVLK